MQEKTIKNVLRKKVDHWVSNIDDPNLVKLIKRDTIITGGALVSLLTNQDVNDFDVYFKTKETTLAVAKYYVEKFKQNPPSKFKDSDKTVKLYVVEENDRIKIAVKSQGIAGESGTEDYQYFECVDDPSEPEKFVEDIAKGVEESKQEGKGSKFRPIFLTTNAITLSDKVQIVVRFYGSIEELHENYDFVHCTCSWEYNTNTLVLPNAALVSIINKRLKYKASKYPLCSIIRTRKFISRGWHIDAGQYLKMTWDLNKLNLNDMDVLEDQLTGMDSAYFAEVLSMLRGRQKECKQIDDTYLMTVVDTIFG